MCVCVMVNDILTEAIARREDDGFYTANQAAAAADDDQAIAALRAATTTNDDYESLKRFTDTVRGSIAETLHVLDHQRRPPPQPASCLAEVRCFAFFLRCLREVRDPWFQRVLEATAYLMEPLRALEARIADHIVDPLQFQACDQMLSAMTFHPQGMRMEHIHHIHEQLLSMQSGLSSIRTTRAQETNRNDCLFHLQLATSCIRKVLTKAKWRMDMDPHFELTHFRKQYRALLDPDDDDDDALYWPQSGFHLIEKLGALLPELGEPNPTEPNSDSESDADEGENLTLKQRIHAMLAELDDMRLHSFDPDDPRSFRCMAGQVMLQDLLLRIDDALEQRELERFMPRRLALAQALGPHTAPPPIAALGDDLVCKIAGMSLDAPPRLWWQT